MSVCIDMFELVSVLPLQCSAITCIVQPWTLYVYMYSILFIKLKYPYPVLVSFASSHTIKKNNVCGLLFHDTCRATILLFCEWYFYKHSRCLSTSQWVETFAWLSLGANCLFTVTTYFIRKKAWFIWKQRWVFVIWNTERPEGEKRKVPPSHLMISMKNCSGHWPAVWSTPIDNSQLFLFCTTEPDSILPFLSLI